ncbi:uncharacterized protein LOC134209456 [Armigeres subalbatus]|uniref:uncharacterized protein LOC134209456 n=1 Tax=Armigeres subalbatus TaxID=124917 RepID=UPI002ED2CD21
MPRVSKRRKAAIHHWITRKGQQFRGETDHVRSTTCVEAQGKSVPWEISQPEAIEDCCSVSSSVSGSDSWGDDDIALPSHQDQRSEICVADDIANLAEYTSVADTRVDELEELQLPPIPLLDIDVDSIWSTFADDDNSLVGTTERAWKGELTYGSISPSNKMTECIPPKSPILSRSDEIDLDFNSLPELLRA